MRQGHLSRGKIVKYVQEMPRNASMRVCIIRMQPIYLFKLSLWKQLPYPFKTKRLHQTGHVVDGNFYIQSYLSQLMQYANNKGADQPAHPCSLISALLFAAWIVQYSSWYSWNFKPLPSLCSCVLPGRKPRRQVFLWRGSFGHPLAITSYQIGK